MGVLQIYTAPVQEPVSREEMKLHLRVDHTDDDLLIDSLEKAARLHIETETGRQLCTATYDWKRNGFPQELRECGDYYVASSNRRERSFKVPRPPLQSVSSITYYDSPNGTLQTLSSSLYAVETAWVSGKVHPSIPHGRIVEAWNQVWPVSRDQTGSVIVRFVAGYGTSEYVPDEFKAAIKILAAHWYENREGAPIPENLSRMIGTLSAGEL